MTTDIIQDAVIEHKEEAPVITISLKELRCVSFELSEYGISNKIPIHLDNYEFQFSINFGLHEPTHHTVTDLNIIVYEKKPDGVKLELAKAYIYLKFLIVNFDDIIKKDDKLKLFQVPDNLIELCNSISLSSARGMFSVKFEGTLYTNCIIPLLDPKILSPKTK
ncbi:MAG: hypothetical protein QM764_02980 [Chitinophagaceae bacterium]